MKEVDLSSVKVNLWNRSCHTQHSDGKGGAVPNEWYSHCYWSFFCWTVRCYLINNYCSHGPGYLKILEIPKGARHLLIQEFKGTPHILGRRREEELVLSNMKNFCSLPFCGKPCFLCFLLQRWRTRRRVTSSSMMKTSSQNPEWWSRRV